MKIPCCNNPLHNSRRANFSWVLLFVQYILSGCNSQSCLENSPVEKKWITTCNDYDDKIVLFNYLEFHLQVAIAIVLPQDKTVVPFVGLCHFAGLSFVTAFTGVLA